MELNSVMFILSLSQEYINRENVVSYEIIDDSINMVVKKDNNSKSLDNYTLFVIKKNGNHVSITKNSNNDSVYYDYLFYDILGRHFCEVYVDSNQTYMSELNYNIFDKKDDYSDAIKEFNIVTDNKKEEIVMDILIPDMYQKSIYSINYEKLYNCGIRCLLFDLDNTCVPYVEKVPSKKLIDLFDYLKDMGFKVILFSNATKKRLEVFKNTLVVDCSYSSRKPSKRKFLKVLKMYNFDLSEVAIIGDQLFTDILGGNRVGIKTILVNPMSKKDMPLTFIFRILERGQFKKFKKRGILKLGNIMNKCIGCGSILQDTDKNKDGYVLDINDKLCQRCFRIRYYNEYKNTIRDNNDYLKILDSINNDDLVVYVTSLLDIRLDYIDSFKNVIVVLTKRDILPKSVKDEKLIKYIKSRYNPLEVIVVSSVKNYNIDYLFDTLRQYKKNNIYVVGTTNGGKSTLINKIIKNYSDNDVVITSSMYPSTTLDKIEINILGLNVIDTPGLINKGSIVNYIDNNLLKKITIKKEIKPKTYQLNGKGSILIEDLIRLDYDTKGTSMTIYVNNLVNIRFLGKDNNKLLDGKCNKFSLDNNKDIVISDLCFIKFTKNVNLNIYSNYDVLIYERDNLI